MNNSNNHESRVGKRITKRSATLRALRNGTRCGIERGGRKRCNALRNSRASPMPSRMTSYQDHRKEYTKINLIIQSFANAFASLAEL